MKNIPSYSFNETSTLGLRINHFRFGKCSFELAETYRKPHRDTHYTFFMLEKGHITTMIDFKEIQLFAPSISCILPSQVHRRVNNLSGVYWAISIDKSLVPRDCNDVFELQQTNQCSFTFSEDENKQSGSLVHLLYSVYIAKGSGRFQFTIINSLTGTFLAMVANYFDKFLIVPMKQSRLLTLKSQFKASLSKHYKTVKSPSGYASLLNVTESYLNEAIKKNTGYPVTYWIRQEVMMEAKRLLYFSDLNVKETAHLLGYENHFYFCRIFKKTVGLSALQFRALYRK